MIPQRANTSATVLRSCPRLAIASSSSSGLRRAQHEVRVELRRRRGARQQVVSLSVAPMTDWDVSPLPVLRGHRDADDRSSASPRADR